MSGGVPANTTTTTTVNQSPWQNPTYQALMLGTKDNPGPITNILRSNAGYMNAYNNMLGKGITPMDVVNSGKYNPTAGTAGTSFQEAAPQVAAEGGIMNARGYASGGRPKAPPKATWSDAQESRRNDLTAKQQNNQPLTKQEKNVLNSLNKKYKGYQAYTDYNTQQQQQAAQEQQAATNTANAQQRILEQSMGQTAFTRINPQTGQLESTNPLFNQAVNRVMDAQQMPEQFGQATNAYNQAISGLRGMTNYTPQQVEAQQIEAAKIARGDIRDVAAQQADVERYKATNIAPTARETGVTTAAPGSWTQAGTAAQYMSPYMQNVVDIQKREAQRDFGKQMAMLNAQAAGQGAYGGSRQAIERSEARRNQAQRLADIEAQGLQQSYSQGMGQFQQEQQLGSQVGMANTAQINQLKSQYMQMGLTEAQANQAAQNAASQFGAAAQNQAYNNYVQQQLQAQLQSQGMDYNTAQQNAAMLMQQRTANQNAALQAAMANQSAGLQANQQNIGAYGQMLSGAQGLGALGTQYGQTNLANIGALGQAASAWQNLGQQYLNTQATNAQNAINFPSNLYSGALNAINAQPSTGGTTTATGTSSPASWMGRAEGGEVEAHKEWDKAKGGKTAKTGIASKGWN